VKTYDVQYVEVQKDRIPPGISRGVNSSYSGGRAVIDNDGSFRTSCNVYPITEMFGAT